MRILMLFLLLWGFPLAAEAQQGRIAVTGVPVVGGYRTLYTSPPSEKPEYDDYGRPLSVPYSGTHYARNLPSQLTLGQGRIEGKPWYFNANGYTSYHYGEHYQPTGGLQYVGHPDAIGYWYPSTWQSAGYCGDTWYDPRLYAPPSGGWSPAPNMREMWIPIERRVPTMPAVTTQVRNNQANLQPQSPHTSEVGQAVEASVKVKEYAITWRQDGSAFAGETGSIWIETTGPSEKPSELQTFIRGYVVVAEDRGKKKTMFHLVEWTGWEFKVKRIFEKNA